LWHPALRKHKEGRRGASFIRPLCRPASARHPLATILVDGRELEQQAKFVRCLNQHAVPAQQQKGGVAINGQGVDRSKVQQAQQACQKYAPGGSGG
jgi:hypothetical protein